MMSEHKQYTYPILIVSILITVIFGTILHDVRYSSFGIDEGFSAWIIQDEMREPETIRETVRLVRDSLLNTLKHSLDSSQPPLYYLLLDVWALLSGDSELALRLPSALMGTISLAGVYAIGRHLFNRKTGFIALLLFGTSGFYLYYAREAQLYSLYLALSIITTLAYLHWRRKATFFSGSIYVIFLIPLFFTHYTAFLVPLIHGLYPLLKTLLWSEKSTRWQASLTIILLIAVPILVLFLMNVMGFSILELPFLIPIVPFLSVLLANLLANIKLSFLDSSRKKLAFMLIFTGTIIFAQLVTYHVQWKIKTDWRETVLNVDANRTVGESALTNFDADSPLAYYAHRTGLLDGISIDIGWREFSPQEIYHIANSLENAPTVWSIVNLQDANSWDAIATLSENRSVTYRDKLEESIFYEFSNEAGDSLSFTFGTDRENQLLAYRGEFYTRYQADVGDEVCIPIQLEALADIPDTYTIGLQDFRGFYSKTLGAHTRGDIIEEELCLTKEYDHDYYLRLFISADTETSERLNLIEDNLVWGDYLVRGVIQQAGE